MGVAALIARAATYHRWYDDLLLLLPLIALFRLAKMEGQSPRVAVGAGALFGALWLSLLAPGALYVLPPPLNAVAAMLTT